MHKRNTIVYLLFIVLLSINFSNAQSKNNIAPSFALCNLEGQYVILKDLLKENNVILAFWASYCNPCKVELPQLVSLEKKYSTLKDLKLVLVNIDSEGKSKAIQVLNELSIKSICLLDPYQVAIKKYNPELKIPATFLINKKGIIVFKAVGEGENYLKDLEISILNL